jgi:AcrR family transcriptional regulator
MDRSAHSAPPATNDRLRVPAGVVRDRILTAAFTLVQTGGPDAMRLDAVASGAGISKATLYRHFRNRANLLGALASERGMAPGLDVPDRRAIILDATVRLIGLQGLRATTMEQIADDAGISPAALYWHFQSKEALCQAVIVRISPIAEVDEFFSVRCTGDLRADLRAFVSLVVGELGSRLTTHLRLAAELPGQTDAFRTFFLANGPLPVWKRVGAYFDEQASKGTLIEAPTMARVLTFGGMLMAGVLTRNVFGDALGVSVEDYAVQAVDTFLTGQATDAYRNTLGGSNDASSRPGEAP